MVKPTGRANVSVTRGEVWLAALDPTVGSETQKTRPCVIISPPEMHDYLRTVMVNDNRQPASAFSHSDQLRPEEWPYPAGSATHPGQTTPCTAIRRGATQNAPSHPGALARRIRGVSAVLTLKGPAFWSGFFLLGRYKDFRQRDLSGREYV
jgi:PemK-like, MazF-like toxin of type II toxin-antitoxin system